MNTVFYKIRHKPTGLFFKPSSGRNKSNFSANGKTYTQRPVIARLPCVVNIPSYSTLEEYAFFEGGKVPRSFDAIAITRSLSDVAKDLELVMYNVVEASVEPIK